MLGAERHTHRERVAVGVFDQAIAPAVRRPVLCRREHGVAVRARATLGFVGIDAEKADLDAETTLLRAREARTS